MTYLTAGGEAVLRTLPAASAIQNLPVAPRPITLAPRALTAANWGPSVSLGAGSSITPSVGGAASAASGTAGTAAAAGGAASTALAIAAGVAALGFGFAVGDAIAGSLGIEYPGGKNALQYFAGGRSPGLGAIGGNSAAIQGETAGPPPFLGGQGVGVGYRVFYQYNDKGPGGNLIEPATQANVAFPPIGCVGPIKKMEAVGPFGAQQLILFHGPNFETVVSNSSAPQGSWFNLKITSVERLDGQPDTDGNPKGDPIPTSSPRANGLSTTSAPVAPAAPAAPAAPSTPTTPTIPPGEPVNPPAERKAPGLPNWLYQLPYAMPAATTGGLTLPPVKPGDNVTPVNTPKPDDEGTNNRPPRKTRLDDKCRCNAPLFNKLDDLENKLNRTLDTAGIVGDGGIFAYLVKMQTFAEKAWESTKLQKVMDALTLVTVLHNASMISRDVGETLGYAISQGLDVLGVEDEKGEALDVNGWFGKQTTAFFEGIFGVERWHGLNETWNKANRIITSASNIVYSIRSISDGVREVVETTGENVGKIGNALKKSGLVTERSYPWMAEKLRAQDRWSRKTARVMDGLESLENTSSAFAEVTSNVKEIQDEFGELQEQTAAFQALIGTPPNTPAVVTPADNAAIATAGDQAAINARSGPAVTAVDMEPALNAAT